MPAPVEAASASTLSLPQQREWLWADARQRVYALMVTSKVPGLRERLAQGGVDDWDGLWTGELEADERAAAPLLVTLRRDSPFTDWLQEAYDLPDKLAARKTKPSRHKRSAVKPRRRRSS